MALAFVHIFISSESRVFLGSGEDLEGREL